MSACPHCGHDPAQLGLVGLLADHRPKARHGDPSTAKLAALKNEPRRGSQRARILAALITAGHTGATTFELAETLRLPYVSVSTRVSELLHGDWATRGERTRATANGGESKVVVASFKALELDRTDLLAVAA